ncbi:nucleotide pyrophosphohydrolase [Sinomonas gamaensis]|uniref:nucleotide pyrophosphohydrolase n=1 Tax=Sinomonas gamaensis TaxID=2565624 RepID=UPI0011092294|nr:nucleotide pyrophosphohydrolase [Sinomonas gamaensis]
MTADRTGHTLKALRELVQERNWGQFHSPENLAKSISIEAAELLECFQWGPPEDNSAVRHELADVITYCLLLADKLGLDPHDIVLEKLDITRAKYPIELSHGRSTKHDQF